MTPSRSIKRLFLAPALCIVAAGFPSATAFNFDMRFELAGTDTQIPNATALLVAATGGSSFAPLLSNTQFLQNATSFGVGDQFGGSYQVVANSFQRDDGPGEAFLFFDEQTFTLSGAWEAGDPLAIVWFPSGTSNVGDPYSFYRFFSLTPPSADANFVTPTIQPIASWDILADISSSSPPIDDGTTTFETGVIAVPEPGIVALIGIGLMTVLYLSRSRRRFV